MPIYEYSCKKCTSTFEVLLKMTDMEKPLTEPCPECKSSGTVGQDATAANFGDPWRMGTTRPDAGWGEVLSKVKSAHPNGHWGHKKFNPLGGA